MKRIIGYLMFLANSEDMKSVWYSLKDKLCKKYGANDGYDVQFIEGKKCNSCKGTGIYKKYYHGRWWNEACWCCTAGWYKLHAYILLERIKVGEYVFHKPTKRTHSKSDLAGTKIPASVTIEGYIRHTKKKYGWLAFSVLCMIFDWGAYKVFVKTLGNGWRCSWWLPKNYLYNIMHVVKNKGDAIPIKDFKKKFKRKYLIIPSVDIDDLPF